MIHIFSMYSYIYSNLPLLSVKSFMDIVKSPRKQNTFGIINYDTHDYS